MKPILFNTEMVRAILEGRKTVTRRVIKDAAMGMVYEDDSPARKPPYSPGDVLYVRETWAQPAEHTFWYRADSKVQNILWRPSIHMPKGAARIFLRVTGVRVERLQDIMLDPPGPDNQVVKEGCRYGCDFIATWENTIKPTDLDKYGWDANPWVWVIEFERCDKPEV